MRRFASAPFGQGPCRAKPDDSPQTVTGGYQLLPSFGGRRFPPWPKPRASSAHPPLAGTPRNAPCAATAPRASTISTLLAVGSYSALTRRCLWPPQRSGWFLPSRIEVVPTSLSSRTKASGQHRHRQLRQCTWQAWMLFQEDAILTAAELTALLHTASTRLRPYLVVCAFAALRPHEAQQLGWEHVTAQGIYVPKAITKTVARYVPVLPTLAAWLDFFGPQTGKIFPHGYRTWRRDFDTCRKRAGLFESWGQDALRHSAISYWLAVEPNRAAVAMWSANSEDVQKRSYENPRSSAEAATWYAVLPQSLTSAPDEAEA